MAESITLRTSVELGIVPTHIKFVGGLVPEEGRLPRGEDGKLLVVTEMAHLVQKSPVKFNCVQISVHKHERAAIGVRHGRSQLKWERTH